MIPVNELRFGNYVIDTTADEPYIKAICTMDMVNCMFLDPIPLTPEILEAAGFKRLSKSCIMSIGRGDIECVDGICNLIQDDGVYFNDGQDIRYLHQLQNLFYALTGEELTIDITAKTAY